MSEEILQVKIDGETRWRCFNNNSDLMSLDEQTIEPLVPSLEVAIDRMLAVVSFAPSSERAVERAELLETYKDIANYRHGLNLVDLDGFFATVEQITEPDKAMRLGLTEAEIGYLKQVAITIRLELAGNPEWRGTTVLDRDGDFADELYLKLFPDGSGDNLVCHPALGNGPGRALDSGLRYFYLLPQSRTLLTPDERAAKLQVQVANAVASLDQLQQAVINRHYGLNGFVPQPATSIAEDLSGSLTTELRAELAKMKGVLEDQFCLSTRDVHVLEDEALRNLRKKKK